MPRVLHLIDTAGPGGAESVLLHLVGGLVEAGWVSRVLVPQSDWLQQRLEERGLETRIVRNRGTIRWRLLGSLVREVLGFRPDLIHAHFLGSAVYGTLAARISSGAPVVCTFHGTPDVDPNDPLLDLKARILRRSRNRIVYVSHHLRRHLEPILGIPTDLGEVIHNGVPFPAEEPPTKTLALPGLDAKSRLIGAVGNLRTAKDYPTLLRAARLVCLADTQAHFVVVGGGEGELLRKLLRQAVELGLNGRVHFLGFREDVWSVMSAFDVFVSSSKTEGLPLASIEAMGIGKAVVLTSCGGVPEIVEDGRSGLLVPVGNPLALAQAVLSLLRDPDRATRLGIEARKRVRTEFSLQSMLTRYIALYRTLLVA